MINIATLIHAQFVINLGYSPAIATASQRPWIVEAQVKSSSCALRNTKTLNWCLGESFSVDRSDQTPVLLNNQSN